MKLDMDKITFESRKEIEIVMAALENSRDAEKEVVQRLIDLLDVRHMNW